jgi:hypothetical protein
MSQVSQGSSQANEDSSLSFKKKTNYKTNVGKMHMRIESNAQVGTGTNKHVEYKLVGEDSLGPFECQRRYRDFDTFRDLLTQRYAGLYIPPMPPKVMQGNQKEMIVEERQFYINEFVQEISTTPYLNQCEELQVFLRPQGVPVDKAMQSLIKFNTDDQLGYFREKLQISETLMPGEL